MADKAILFGINKYNHISDLQGCINDVKNLEDLLRVKYRFKPENIRIKTNGEVTRESVTDGFAWLRQDTQPGDRLLFHFSGHGSYTPSKDGDEDVDELICLYDMDWDNPGTYLVDDDIRGLLGSLPEADITVILDCCHSGDGTRAVTRAGIAAPGVTCKDILPIKYKSKAKTQGDAHDSIARFVSPPEKFLRSRKARRHAIARTVAHRSGMNHLLLAGARDTQPAADAFINGTSHGAFTYYLCESARKNGPQASAKSIMEDAIHAIKKNNYPQDPQIEGRGQDDPLFGDSESGTSADPLGRLPEILDQAFNEGLQNEHGVADGSGSAVELLNRMLTVSEKFIDLADRLLPAEEFGRGAVTTRALGNEVYVAVHGISRHVPGYSNEWYNALSSHLHASLQRGEVMWSDLVNRRDVSENEEDEAVLRAAIQRELDERAEAIRAEAGKGASELSLDEGSRAAERAIVDDFVLYMVNQKTREAIIKRFTDVVSPLLASGKSLHIVAHSWGAIVTYEGLRRLDALNMPGVVENLFTLGSALSIGAVRVNLFGRVGDGRRPTHVSRFYNLDAGGDLVGGRMDDHFHITHEFLDLRPVGCRIIPFTNKALNPVCAHGSYFHARNKGVNRDILARVINS